MTSPQPVSHLAFVRASSGRSAELGERLQQLLEPSRQAPGCLSFNLQRSTSDTQLWLLSGSWCNSAAMADYFASPTLMLFGDLLQAQLLDSLDVQTFGEAHTG